MNKHYFSATHLSDDNSASFLCSFHRALKTKDWIVVDLGYPYGITTAQIERPVDELKALSSKQDILTVICAPTEIKEYEQARKSKIQAQTILNQMEERNRTVALLEKCKKNAAVDSEYAELWNAYQKLIEVSAMNTSLTEQED